MKRFYKLILLFTIYFLPMSVALAKNNLEFHIQGVKGDILRNIQARLVVERRPYGETLSAKEIQVFFRHMPKYIRESIEPFGYFNPTIQSRLTRNGAQWQANFNIDLGMPVRIKRIDLKVAGPGRNNMQLQDFIAHVPLKEGDIFTATDYSHAKDEFFKVASNQGYIKAAFEKNNVLINTHTHEAIIIMYLQTGERYYFGPLIFNKSVYDPEFLQRFNEFCDNEPFSSEKLIEFQQQMTDSEYFASVATVPDLTNVKNYRVPVKVSVEPPKERRYTFGLGYGTLSGPRLTSTVNLNRVTNTGQSFESQLKLSQVLSGLAAKYYIPGNRPLTDFWTLGANYKIFEPKNGRSISKILSVGFETKRNELQLSADLNFLVENFRVYNQPSNLPPSRTSHMLYPSLNLAYSKTDDLINPTWGHSIDLTVQGAAQQILSTTSFIQGEIEAKYLFSPFDIGQIILRTDLGATAVKKLYKLPLSLRFFTGGPNSVRGYRDSSIGPGRFLMVGSAEYRHRVVGNWNAAIFYDVGNATDHIMSPPLSRGAGVGVIYTSPIGPVKVYIARALTTPGRPLRLELNIGPEF